jgi:hypothetical protein
VRLGHEHEWQRMVAPVVPCQLWRHDTCVAREGTISDMGQWAARVAHDATLKGYAIGRIFLPTRPRPTEEKAGSGAASRKCPEIKYKPGNLRNGEVDHAGSIYVTIYNDDCQPRDSV